MKKQQRKRLAEAIRFQSGGDREQARNRPFVVRFAFTSDAKANLRRMTYYWNNYFEYSTTKATSRPFGYTKAFYPPERGFIVVEVTWVLRVSLRIFRLFNTDHHHHPCNRLAPMSESESKRPLTEADRLSFHAADSSLPSRCELLS